ncbi:MAG: DUF3617 domain-containing protein [Pseudomonadota bacterium]|nr:DUF3617 domain-containing protein [Pseudomonadota bacterium]MDP8994461.1 DUF3617 domain-containing protein [Pseudomonadota bacterium]
MNRRLLPAAALLALSSCGGEEGREMSGNEVAQELASIRIEPGQWEVTTEIISASGSGFPRQMLEAMRGQQSTRRHCITPEQAARPDGNFLANQENSNCTYRDFSMRGGRISGTMTCRGGTDEGSGEVTTEMRGSYRPESYDMTMQMRMAMQMPGMSGSETLQVETRATGRRIGECPAGEGGGEDGNNQ